MFVFGTVESVLQDGVLSLGLALLVSGFLLCAAGQALILLGEIAINVKSAVDPSSDGSSRAGPRTLAVLLVTVGVRGLRGGIAASVQRGASWRIHVQR